MDTERVIVVTILNVLFGIGFVFAGVAKLRGLITIRDTFKKTNATVLECERILSTRKSCFNESNSYKYTVRYTDYKDSLVETSKIIENTTRKFSIGDEIEIYYNPNVTDEYVIYEHNKGKNKACLFLGIGIIVIFRLIYEYFEYFGSNNY